jgi:hypothetical protein
MFLAIGASKKKALPVEQERENARKEIKFMVRMLIMAILAGSELCNQYPDPVDKLW